MLHRWLSACLDLYSSTQKKQGSQTGCSGAEEKQDYVCVCVYVWVHACTCYQCQTGGRFWLLLFWKKNYIYTPKGDETQMCHRAFEELKTRLYSNGEVMWMPGLRAVCVRTCVHAWKETIKFCRGTCICRSSNRILWIKHLFPHWYAIWANQNPDQQCMCKDSHKIIIII